MLYSAKLEVEVPRRTRLLQRILVLTCVLGDDWLAVQVYELRIQRGHNIWQGGSMTTLGKVQLDACGYAVAKPADVHDALKIPRGQDLSICREQHVRNFALVVHEHSDAAAAADAPQPDSMVS